MTERKLKEARVDGANHKAKQVQLLPDMCDVNPSSRKPIGFVIVLQPLHVHGVGTASFQLCLQPGVAG